VEWEYEEQLGAVTDFSRTSSSARYGFPASRFRRSASSFGDTNVYVLFRCVKSRSQTDARAAVQNPSGEKVEGVGGCFAMREDYFECLHGRKESARIKKVLAEMKKQEYEAKHGVAPSH
jgi:hypothetical protein